MSDENKQCGHTTAEGTPCQLPGSFGDGKCHHHTDFDGPEDAGRPTKLTKERQERIASIIEQGGSIREACGRAGIHRETFGNWMKRGQEQSEGVFAEFFDRLTRARGEGEGTYRQALMQIAIQSDDTATLMAMLKQRYPESWGDVNRGEQSGGVVVNVSEPDEYSVDPETLEVVDE